MDELEENIRTSEDEAEAYDRYMDRRAEEIKDEPPSFQDWGEYED
jgi:hypothetical protein